VLAKVRVKINSYEQDIRNNPKSGLWFLSKNENRFTVSYEHLDSEKVCVVSYQEVPKHHKVTKLVFM
jgi:hypothetical protein